MVIVRYSRSEVILMIAISIVLNVGIVIFNYAEPVTWELAFLVIVSWVLSQINPRLTCLSYVISLIYSIDLVITLFGVKPEMFSLPYSKLIFLVGVLHIIEGIMAYMYGSINNRCVVDYKNGKIIGGYRAYRKWYIPLFVFNIKGIYLPLLCVLCYVDETYTMIPKEKSKRNGICVVIYGVFIVVMWMIQTLNSNLVTISILCMPLAHELLFYIDEYDEQPPYIYTLPKKGVRIIEVCNNQKDETSIHRGDIIRRINGRQINSQDLYYEEIKADKIIMILEDLKGNKKILNFDKDDYIKLGVIILPEN